MSSTSGYELHQKLRTKAVRLLKKKDYNQCIQILYDGAKELLAQNEQGSGCDLATYMIQVYTQAEIKMEDQSRKRITDLLELTKNDFWRKKVLDSAVKWSATPNSPQGDWKLRLFAGKLLAKDGSYHEAEKHLLSACLGSPDPSSSEDSNSDHPAFILAQSTFDWLESYSKESDQKEWETLVRLGSGNWAIRCVVPLVTAESLPSASLFLSTYLNILTKSQPKILLPINPNPKPYSPPSTSSTSSSTSSSRQIQLYITGSSDLNFIQMALALISTADSLKRSTGGARVSDEVRNQWIGMINQWRKEGGNDEILLENLNEISEVYFGIQSRKVGGNFMSDMMNSLMGGQPTGQKAVEGNKGKSIKQGSKPQLVSKGESSVNDNANVNGGQKKVEAPEEEDLD